MNMSILFFRKLLPILESFAETGTAKQAKHAVYCINNIVSDKETVFGNVIDVSCIIIII